MFVILHRAFCEPMAHCESILVEIERRPGILTVVRILSQSICALRAHELL